MWERHLTCAQLLAHLLQTLSLAGVFVCLLTNWLRPSLMFSTLSPNSLYSQECLWILDPPASTSHWLRLQSCCMMLRFCCIGSWSQGFLPAKRSLDQLKYITNTREDNKVNVFFFSSLGLEPGDFENARQVFYHWVACQHTFNNRF